MEEYRDGTDHVVQAISIQAIEKIGPNPCAGRGGNMALGTAQVFLQPFLDQNCAENTREAEGQAEGPQHIDGDV
jgi:hypothetical protein